MITTQFSYRLTGILMDFFFFAILSIVEDIILNSKDLPDAKVGDVVEIFLPEDDGVRLLLQITNLNEDKNKGNKGINALVFLIDCFFFFLNY